MQDDEVRVLKATKTESLQLFVPRIIHFVFLLVITAVSCSAARAGTIVLFAPLSGDYSEIGAQFKAGAELAFKEAQTNHQLKIVDTGCDPAKTLEEVSGLDQQNIALLAGFYCSDAAKAVATRFAGSGIPLLVTGARSVRLIKDRDRESWNLWRMSPGDDYPAIVSARAIEELWKDKPFALVDDGTIYGRTFSDALRTRLDESDLSPQFSDTFRAAQSTQAGLLRRLQRSGVSAAFIASATTEDLVTIAKDAAQLGIDLNIMATEAMMVLPFLENAEAIPPGLKVIGWPQPVSSRLETELIGANTRPELAVYQGFATVEIALAAIAASPDETTRKLASQTFETVVGTVRFNGDGSSSFNPYRLLEWDGNALVPASPAATR